MSLSKLENKIINSAKYAIEQKGNRILGFYLFKLLMVLQPLKIIRNIGQRNPSFIGFFCSIVLLMISLSAILTLWIPEGIISSDVVRGQSQCCDYIVALYDNRVRK